MLKTGLRKEGQTPGWERQGEMSLLLTKITHPLLLRGYFLISACSSTIVPRASFAVTTARKDVVYDC